MVTRFYADRARRGHGDTFGFCLHRGPACLGGGGAGGPLWTIFWSILDHVTHYRLVTYPQHLGGLPLTQAAIDDRGA
jgi:hypothetical protein